MEVPTPNYIRQLYVDYAVPSTIRRHLEKVRDVGQVLSDGLVQAGVPLDNALVDAGCLIHDAFKTVSLGILSPVPEFGYVPSENELEMQRQLKSKYEGMHETLVAADIIRPRFPKFAEFVSNIGSTGNPTYLNEELPWVKELQIVHYADWRIQWNKVVPFSDRLDYLKKTYLGRNHPDKGEDWWRQMLGKEIALEVWIFEHLDFRPDDLASRVR